MFNYSDAFKQLKLLDEEVFNLDNQGLADLKMFQQEEPSVMDQLSVIDTEAEKEEDLQDSYVGKVILECPVCSSLLYKAAADVHVDEELGLANVDEECPYCYTTQGFKVIGQVNPMEPEKEVSVEVVAPEQPKEITAEDFTEVKEEPIINDDLDKEEMDKELSTIDFNSDDLNLDDDKKKKDDDDFELLDESLDDGFDDYKVVRINHFADAEKYADDVVWQCCRDDLFYHKYRRLYNFYFLISRETGKPEYAVLVQKATNKKYVFDKDNKSVDVDLEGVDFENLRESLALKEKMLAEGVTEATVDLENKELNISVTDGSLNSANLQMDDGKKVQLEVHEKEVSEDEPNEMLAPIDDSTMDRIGSEETEEPEISEDDLIEEPAEESSDESELFAEEPMEFSDEENSKDIKGEEIKGADDFEEIEESVEDINENNISGLIEKYLKRCFNNVTSYELKEAWMNADKTQLKLVGNILFESGSNKKTTFIFTPENSDGHGHVSFLGENVELKTGKNSFKLFGNIINESFEAERMSYNHSLNESINRGVVILKKNLKEDKELDGTVGYALRQCMQDEEFRNAFNDSLTQIALGTPWKKVRDELVNVVNSLSANENARQKIAHYLNDMNPFLTQRQAEHFLSKLFGTLLDGKKDDTADKKYKRLNNWVKKNEDLIEEDQILQEYRTKGAVGMKNRAEAPAPRIKELKPSREEQKTALACALYSDPEIEKKFNAVLELLNDNLASKEWTPNTEENPFLDSTTYSQVSIVDKNKKFWEKGNWQYNLNGIQSKHWTELRDKIVEFFEDEVPEVTITKEGISKTFNPAKSIVDRLKSIPSSWGESSAYGSMLGTIGADLTGKPESSIVNADNELVHYDVVK